jgi:hypothetical protein
MRRLKRATVTDDLVLKVVWDDATADSVDLKVPRGQNPHALRTLGPEAGATQPRISDDELDLVWPSGLTLSARLITWWLEGVARWRRWRAAPPSLTESPSGQLHAAYRAQITHDPRGTWSNQPLTFADRALAQDLLQRATDLDDGFGAELCGMFLRPEAARLRRDEGQDGARAALALYHRCATTYADQFSALEIGKMLLRGEGAARDPVEARRWFECAAFPWDDTEIDVMAKVWLAELYLAGKGGLPSAEYAALGFYTDIDQLYGVDLPLHLAQVRIHELWPDQAANIRDRSPGSLAHTAEIMVRDVIRDIAAAPS